MTQPCSLYGACSDYTNKETHFFLLYLYFFIVSASKTRIHFYLKLKRFRFWVM